MPAFLAILSQTLLGVAVVTLAGLASLAAHDPGAFEAALASAFAVVLYRGGRFIIGLAYRMSRNG